MRTLIRPVFALLFVAAFALPLSGCAEKTDCKRLNKAMTRCSQDLWNTLEPRGRGLISERWRRDRNSRHFRYCNRIKGVYKQSGKINKCLGIKDCKKFAQCFCRAVKKASECGRVKK